MNTIVTTKGTPWRFLPLLCLLLVLLLGLYLRLGTATGTQVDRPIRNDAKDYVAYAWNLKISGVYSSDPSALIGSSVLTPQPDAARPPAYPWLLRTMMGARLDRSFLSRVCYAQAWIAEATLLCATLLAMELVGVWAGLILGLLVALSPHQSIYVAYLLTETTFGGVVVLATGAAVLALRSNQPHWRLMFSCCAGILFGLSCLTRPTLDQWPFALVFMLLWPSIRRFRGEIIALVLGFILMMSPWWLRNEITLHRMSDPGKMIETLHDGSYPNFRYEDRPETFGYPYSFDPNTPRAVSSLSGIFEDLRIKFTSNPVEMVNWYLFGKVAYFFHWSPPDGWADMFTYPVLRSPWLTSTIFIIITSVMLSLYTPLIIFGLLGTCVAFLSRTKILFGSVKADGIRFVALLHLFAIGVHVMGAPFARYSVPFRPITFLLAIFLMVWIYRSYYVGKQSSVVDTVDNA
ncbi:hypothetical protein EO087_08065 [Dyella sp. M7H15-1]|uniref:glycosyltransferase family 39 protein n=1 Tax=Dyella sp. M7H15-1 TaxID=2501295 RepID=UPI001004DE90|nr:glycosyltransferase family 39 protein [Dyella sp. M7H15-1]QAU23950.1 hypothetical protein EO087_08065 [Dyella sp. M7H15-1]